MAKRTRVKLVIDNPPEEVKLPVRPGVKSIYDSEMHPKAAKLLASRGAIQSELADCFGVTTRTITNWMLEHKEFNDAVHSGAHDMFDPRVERALAEQALGFYVDEEEVVVVGPQDNKYAEKVTVRKYIKPNVTAAIFFLKNRLPAKYRDVHKVEVESKDLPSAEDLKVRFATMVQGLIEEGIFTMPPKRIMKDVTPRE